MWVVGAARVSTSVSWTNDSLLIKLYLSNYLLLPMRDSIKFCLFLLRLLHLYYILTKYIYIQFSYFAKNDCFLFIPINSSI